MVLRRVRRSGAGAWLCLKRWRNVAMYVSNGSNIVWGDHCIVRSRNPVDSAQGQSGSMLIVGMIRSAALPSSGLSSALITIF